MICYSLRCGTEHEFEAWFRDSAGYDEQRAVGDIMCPVCGDTEIVKALTTPSIPRKGNRPTARVAQRTEALTHKITEAVEQLRDHVEKNCDYVGEQFADEARKIHYGETEERSIYGEASVNQASELLEEGIEVYNLPQIRRQIKN